MVEDSRFAFGQKCWRKAGIRKRDSAVSASNDFSRAQSTSGVTASNDQMLKQDAIIQQVKRIKVLKDDEILSTDEFNEERDKLVTEHEELWTILCYYSSSLGETL